MSFLGRRRRADDDDGEDERSQGLFVTPAPSSRSPSRSPPPKEELLDDDEGDEGTDEEVEEEVYDQYQEQFPELAAYDLEVMRLKSEANKLAEGLAEHLNPHKHISQDIDNMAANALAAAICPQVKKPIIMVLGTTGSGKSSTTNSFVDNPSATRAAAAGESCTCVPTIITSRLPGQTTEYAAHVRFFDQATRRSFFEEQLKNYIRFHFQADPDWDAEENQEHSNRADAAEKVFRALFCNQFDFESPGQIKTYLSQRHGQPGQQQAVIETMMTWSQELFQDMEVVEDHPCLDFQQDTAEELNDEVDPNIFEQPEYEIPALWPLVEHVRKGFANSRVLEHVDILDLPGTADVNSVRSEIAHKFATACDALWVVSMIHRVASDAALDLLLAKYGERFGDFVAVIATSSDANVDAALAKYLQERGQSTRQYGEYKTDIDAVKGELRRVAKQLEKARGTKRQRTLSREKAGELRDRKEELEEELQKLVNEQFEFLVDARNTYIKKRLQKEKQRHLKKGSRLEVFGVSNTQYTVWKGGESQNGPQMSVETTSIPGLREYALEMAAPAEFRNIDAFINKVMVIVRGAALWAESNTTKSCSGSLMKIVNEPGRLLEVYIEGFLNDVKAPPTPKGWFAGFGDYLQGTQSPGSFTTELIKPLRADRNRFVLAALAIKRQIEATVHHASVRAFFRKDGRHQPKNQAYQIWNERFTADQTENVIDPNWERMLSHQRGSLKSMVGKIKHSVGEIPEQLGQYTAAVPVPLERVRLLVAGHINRIQIAYDNRTEEMNKQLSNVKLDATRDVDTAYFTRAMRQMYDMAKSITGTGCTKAMLSQLETELQRNGDDSPFEAVPNGLEKDLIKAADTVAHNVQSDIKTILTEMSAQFETIFQNDAPTPGEADARAALRPFLEAQVVEVARMERELAQVKRQYKL